LERRCYALSHVANVDLPSGRLAPFLASGRVYLRIGAGGNGLQPWPEMSVCHGPRRLRPVAGRPVPGRLRSALRRWPRRSEPRGVPTGMPRQSQRRSLLAHGKSSSGAAPGSRPFGCLLQRTAGGHPPGARCWCCRTIRQADLSGTLYAADLVGLLISCHRYALSETTAFLGFVA
jgi:hypothetical protein